MVLPVWATGVFGRRLFGQNIFLDIFGRVHFSPNWCRHGLPMDSLPIWHPYSSSTLFNAIHLTSRTIISEMAPVNMAPYIKSSKKSRSSHPLFSSYIFSSDFFLHLTLSFYIRYVYVLYSFLTFQLFNTLSFEASLLFAFLLDDGYELKAMFVTSYSICLLFCCPGGYKA